MFNEEKVIDGVLCHRSTPRGNWKQYTHEAMTVSFIAMRGMYETSKMNCDKAEARLDKIMKACNEP